MNDVEHGNDAVIPVSHRIAEVGKELAQAFEELVAALPDRPQRPQALARALGMDKNASHRLVTAIRDKDPFATVHIVPGPEPLRRFAEAARRHRLPTALTERVERAINSFEALIENEAGDRSALDAMIASWLPGATERYERMAKQSIYRGARQLKGVSAAISFAAHLLHPSSDPKWGETAIILGSKGLQRIRPDATYRASVAGGESAPLTFARIPIHDPHHLLWRRYCSRPDENFIVHEVPGSNHRFFELSWRDSVGRSSERDLVLRQLLPHGLRLHRTRNDPRPKAAVGGKPTVPSKLAIFDLILHADVYPDWRPKVRILEPGAVGRGNPNDPGTDLYVLSLAERVQPLGTGIERCRAAEVPDYIEMLMDACAELGWDHRQFRGFRCQIEYPVFGADIQYVIDLPEEPAPAH